jgi:hypothetical protein
MVTHKEWGSIPKVKDTGHLVPHGHNVPGTTHVIQPSAIHPENDRTPGNRRTLRPLRELGIVCINCLYTL